jgi:hypothetical protein
LAGQNEPVLINGYADFERLFGGLWVNSAMSYAVRDFYLNGGSQAIVVRLVASDGKAATLKLPAKSSDPSNVEQQDDESKKKRTVGDNKQGTLTLEAANPGIWGNALAARVDDDVSEDAAQRYEVSQGNLFNLSVREGSTGPVEVFRNVTVVKESPRRVDKVLENESKLVRVKGDLSPERPANKDWITEENATGTDGAALKSGDFTSEGKEAGKQGLYALEKADLFNLLCIPPYKNGNDGVDASVITAAAAYCEKRRAMLLVDPPSSWTSKEKVKEEKLDTTSKNAAVFFPRLRQPNPLRDNQVEDFAPCGAVAGVFARTDAQRGVWKAPAGLDATLVGVPQLSVPLTDAENGELNPLGINCLRTMPAVGPIVWGARTLQGDDRLASEWKYIPVRRLALYIEESLYRGTKWVVFEPNDEPLWSQIRLNLGAFMHNLFRQGAFQGKTPREAYFVKCDRETTTQDDINRGIVNIVVGFAPLKPAEFVIIKIQQMAGQIAT